MSINAQPFNPTFKLVGNLVEDQVLVYDSSENAFVNSTNTGGGAGAGFDAAVNEGTGLGVWKGSAGTTLQIRVEIWRQFGVNLATAFNSGRQFFFHLAPDFTLG